MQHKLPAASSVAVDLDDAAIMKFNELCPGFPRVDFYRMSALDFLKCYPFRERDFIYLDPPYLMATRKSQKQMYRFEMTEKDHADLLTLILPLRSDVAISGYESDLYNEALDGWRKINYQAIDRRGNMRTETVWMNYPEPVELHDYRYLGSDHRQRYNSKRKIDRWKAKLQKMDTLERYALLTALNEYSAAATADKETLAGR